MDWKEARQRQLTLYKQRIMGLFLLVIGILLPTVDGDITASVLFIPAGIALALTRQQIL